MTENDFSHDATHFEWTGLGSDEPPAFPGEFDDFSTEDVVRIAAQLPVLRSGLRPQVVASAVAACRRQRAAHRLQNLVAGLILFVASLSAGGYYFSTREATRSVTSVAAHDLSSGGSESREQFNVAFAFEMDPSDYVLLAMRQRDSWAVVDAFASLRSRRIHDLRNVIWRD